MQMSLRDDHRRALAILARRPDGRTEADMLGHGFTAALLTELVESGLATANPQDTRGGRYSVTVAWITITDAGRVAIALRSPPEKSPAGCKRGHAHRDAGGQVLRAPDHRRSSRRSGRAIIMLLHAICSRPHMKKPVDGLG